MGFYYFFLSSPVQTVGSSQGAVYCFPALTNCLNGLYLFRFSHTNPPHLDPYSGEGEVVLRAASGDRSPTAVCLASVFTVEVPARRCFWLIYKFFPPFVS